MLHKLILYLGLVACNPYVDKCTDQVFGGNVDQLVANEGYGLPLPFVVSDFGGKTVTIDEIQTAMDNNAYVIVQLHKPLLLNKPLNWPKHSLLMEGGDYCLSQAGCDDYKSWETK